MHRLNIPVPLQICIDVLNCISVRAFCTEFSWVSGSATGNVGLNAPKIIKEVILCFKKLCCAEVFSSYSILIIKFCF
jgi:hypothetical protein